MRQVHGLSGDGMKIILDHFDGTLSITNTRSAEDKCALILDIETTGLNRNQDKIIEIAYVSFYYHRETRKISEIVEYFSELEDPGIPLNEDIKRITGYDDSYLAGKNISWEKVAKAFTKADIIIAHNAYFDRGFVDRYLQESKEKIWACSANLIDWKKKGHSSRALECLAKDHGFFYKSHNALIDVQACLKILNMTDPDSGSPYLAELLDQAKIHKKNIIANGSRYEFRESLKQHGFKWDATNRYWHKIVPYNTYDDERFIQSNSEAGELLVQMIPLKENYK